MCGIVGFVMKKEFALKDVMASLKRLEYRGYDSFGIADNRGRITKSVGGIDIKKIPDGLSNVAICHTRWATHGGVTENNAHPHASCDGEIMIVHNGIINNYSELRKEMEKAGHIFKSETDSEVIAHFFEKKDVKQAMPEFFSKISGEFAVLLIKKDDSRIYAFKRGSPLVLGLLDNGYAIASDIYAFSDKTNNAIFFNENEFAVISPERYEFYNEKNVPVQKKVTAFQWKEEQSEEKFDHYMIKEIKEIPGAARRLVLSLENEQKESVEKLVALIKSSKRIMFLASGSSYHAALLGAQFLTKAGIDAHAVIASEFRGFTIMDKDTLAIAVSQSGETMDVIKALNGVKAIGVKVASIVNIPYSTVQRMSGISINIEAGQEICVAATKTFVNQTLVMAYLAAKLGYSDDINCVAKFAEKVLSQEENVKALARSLTKAKDIYILGRWFSYPVAREIALKLKEIAYIHAEGMMAGELKHGTLALIEKGTPVICLMPRSDVDIVSNAHEVEARGARVVAFAENGDHREKIDLESADRLSFIISSVIAGQLLTYYIAKEKGLPIDKPRNLAKSVTVR